MADHVTITARSLPSSVAAVAAELELLAPETVSRATIADALEATADPRAGDPGRVDAVIDVLRRRGWLLPLRTRGVWEFAPAARSGAFRSGDPFTELRAAQEVHPGLSAAVAMESAAFRRGLAEHPPSPDVLAVPKATRTDSLGALRAYRLVRLDLPDAASTEVDGVQMHTVAALLAAMALQPRGYRDWRNVGAWLTTAAARVTVRKPAADAGGLRGPGGLTALLKGAPYAAWARAAYLLRAGDQLDAAAIVLAAAPPAAQGPFYLGPRDRRAHYDHATGVYDALLAVA